jgi:L-asparaginase/Glu-tRNA(Gln) amidotransferase subunit D
VTLVVNLGGTIALTYADGEPRALTGNDVIDAPDFQFVELTNQQSYALEWRHLVELRRAVLNEAANGERRFIVLMGTDAAEELLMFLELTRLPVRVAVLVALSPHDATEPQFVAARAWLDADEGPSLSFWCDDQHVALPVEKVFNGDRWQFRHRSHRAAPRQAVLPVESDLTLQMPRIPITPVGIGAADWICAVLEALDFDGLVIEAYAAGDVPPAVVDAIEEAIAQGCPVVLASQSRPGKISSAFPGLKGASAHLLELGVLSAGSLTASLARMQLAVALAAVPRVDPAAVFAPDLDRTRL